MLLFLNTGKNTSLHSWLAPYKKIQRAIMYNKEMHNTLSGNKKYIKNHTLAHIFVKHILPWLPLFITLAFLFFLFLSTGVRRGKEKRKEERCCELSRTVYCGGTKCMVHPLCTPTKEPAAEGRKEKIHTFFYFRLWEMTMQ